MPGAYVIFLEIFLKGSKYCFCHDFLHYYAFATEDFYKYVAQPLWTLDQQYLSVFKINDFMSGFESCCKSSEGREINILILYLEPAQNRAQGHKEYVSKRRHARLF